MNKRTLDRPTLLLAAAFTASLWDWAATESKRRALRAELEAARHRARAANEQAVAFRLRPTTLPAAEQAQLYVELSRAANAAAAEANAILSQLVTTRPSQTLNWLFFMPTMLLVVAWGIHRGRVHERAEKRRRAGLCQRCGYDMRATPGRCPECGSPAGNSGPPDRGQGAERA